MLKLPDDMIEVYADLINRYPAIIALIDPFKKQVGEQGHVSLITMLTCFKGNSIVICQISRPMIFIHHG